MPTTKKRVNITPTEDTYVFLAQIAERDGVPVSAKALQLLQIALEIEEDTYFSKLGDEIVSKNRKFYSHEEAWS